MYVYIYIYIYICLCLKGMTTYRTLCTVNSGAASHEKNVDAFVKTETRTFCFARSGKLGSRAASFTFLLLQKRHINVELH